jgi:hypothetical protein
MDVGGAAPPSTAGEGGRLDVVASQTGQAGAGLDHEATSISKRTPQEQA